MPRPLYLVAVASLAIWTLSCNSGLEEQPPLDLSAQPTDELRTMVQETPSDFTWGFFEDNIVVKLRSDRDWEGSLVLSGFQIANGDIVDRLTTAPFQTNAEELSNGLLTEEVFTAEMGITDWSTQKTWTIEFSSINAEWGGKRTRSEQPVALWTPDNAWTPSEIEQAAMAEADLAPDQTLYVIYPQLEDSSAEVKQTTQPFGIVMPEGS